MTEGICGTAYAVNYNKVLAINKEAQAFSGHIRPEAETLLKSFYCLCHTGQCVILHPGL